MKPIYEGAEVLTELTRNGNMMDGTEEAFQKLKMDYRKVICLIGELD